MLFHRVLIRFLSLIRTLEDVLKDFIDIDKDCWNDSMVLMLASPSLITNNTQNGITL